MYLHMHGWLGRAMCDHHSSAHIRYTDTNTHCLVRLKVPASLQRVLSQFLPSLPDPCFGEGAGGGHGVPLSSMPRHFGKYCTGLLESVVFPRCHCLPVSTFQEGVGRGVQCPRSEDQRVAILPKAYTK